MTLSELKDQIGKIEPDFNDGYYAIQCAPEIATDDLIIEILKIYGMKFKSE